MLVLLACTAPSTLTAGPTAVPGADPRFDRAGAHLGSVTARLTAWGRDELRLLPEVEPTGGERLQYRHPDVTEWWVPMASAAEQGFVVGRSPPGAGPLVFEVTLAGAREVSSTGFADDAGRPWMVSRLRAWDATHRRLPVRPEPVATGYRIVVDDAGARFPVVVDPLYASPLLSVAGGTNAELGGAVTGGGDFDGDGYADFALGAPGDDAVYVYEGAGASPALARTLTGTAGARFGGALDGRCDYDGDGFADLVVGAEELDTDEDGAGGVSVYWGAAGGLSASRTWTFAGDQRAARLGLAVACAGDVNGDGYDDLLTAAPDYDASDGEFNYDDRGRVYLHLGGADRFDDDPVVFDGVAHPQADSTSGDWRYGRAMAGLGDTNADGYGDVVICEPGYEYVYTDGFTSGTLAGGKVFVYEGSAGGLDDDADLTVRKSGDNEELCRSAAGGDFDGDGHGDLAYGTPNHHDPDRGAFFVRLGGSSGLPESDDLQVSGEYSQDSFALTLATAGDLDNDGYDDLVAGAPEFGSNDRGKAYLYAGSAGGLQEDAIAVVTGSADGAALGAALAAAGDVDGNGYGEIIVGAPGTGDGGDDDGDVYLYRAYADPDDIDGDGVPSGSDCDDLDAQVGGWRSWYPDEDGDGYGSDASGITYVDCTQPSDGAANADDCDDTDAAVKPGGSEVCDLVDNDCDGEVDDDDADVTGQVAWHEDADGDGYGVDAVAFYACWWTEGYNADGGDCDDSNASIAPGLAEVCDAANQDEDCDGLADDADTGAAYASQWGLDADGDGYGSADGVIACDAPGEAWVEDTTDCDDTDPTGAVAETWWIDIDGDGWGGIGLTSYECGQPEDWFGYAFVNNNDDCDNEDAAVGAPTTWYRDTDRDGYGGTAVESCTGQPSGTVANNWDCNDANAAIGTAGWKYRDADGDGYGDPAQGIAVCGSVAGYVTTYDLIQPWEEDCDDADPDVNPGELEVCNGVDDDCDDLLDDEDGVAYAYWFVDADGDGTGWPGDVVTSCAQPTGYVANADDCDDGNPQRAWTFPEICDDADVDEDCDGLADLNDDSYAVTTAEIWYGDDDGDGHGEAPGYPYCDPPGGWVASGDDCDDEDASVWETLTFYVDTDGDGLGGTDTVAACALPAGAAANDDDCDDLDAGVGGPSWQYPDLDDDGYGDLAGETSGCDALPGYLVTTGYLDDAQVDCDDQDATVNPGAVELCNGVDDDCDGPFDDDDGALDALTWYTDLDRDEWGGVGVTTCSPPAGSVLQGGDCLDTDASVNPHATEYCDGVDEDCDGSVDEGLGTIVTFPDADGDGWGDPSAPFEGCYVPDGNVTADIDCDDTDPTVYLGAPETCGDGVDQDCSGADEACASCTVSLTLPTEGADLTSEGRFAWTGTCDGYWLELSPDPTFPAYDTIFNARLSAAANQSVVFPSVAWPNVARRFEQGGYARVVGAVGGETVTSATVSFDTTAAPLSTFPDPVATCSVALREPADGAQITGEPTFRWGSGCTAARLEFSESPAFPLDSTLVVGSFSGTSASLNAARWNAVAFAFPDGGYWRVVAGAADGEHVSDTRSFAGM